MDEAIVINSGPLITFSRMEAFGIIDQLPFEFVTPAEVRDELLAGHDDLLATSFVASIQVMELGATRIASLFSNLDSGEAAVIQLALEKGISNVCLDERKGRRIAASHNLSLLGSLGLLGRAKTLGIIKDIRPFIERAMSAGIYYEMNLVERFLGEFREPR